MLEYYCQLLDEIRNVQAKQLGWYQLKCIELRL